MSRVAERYRRLGGSAFGHAMEENLTCIERLLERDRQARLLDLGCDDGARTLRFGAIVAPRELHGVELVEAAAARARARGIVVAIADLNRELPYPDAAFDAIVSNQVIEHLADTDRFVAELWRLLRPGGYAVTSTENLASWHNIAALALGWQPFSLTNVSVCRGGIGNPVALHRSQEGSRHETSWQHVRVFAYRGLRELFEAHGFIVEAIDGAGYYPLPSRLARLDPRHAALLTIKTRRPKQSDTR